MRSILETERLRTRDNIILATDSYKVGHWGQYPPSMTYMVDYFESRGGKRGWTQFALFQYTLMHYLTKRVTVADVLEAKQFYAAHFGFDDVFPYEGWMKVATVYGGRLPIRIRAVPEGGVYPVHTPLFTVESLDPDLFWVVSWVEGIVQKNWYPTTVATLDFFTKLEMYARLAKTSDNPLVGLSFMLHDFGYRGASSDESAKVGGAAALVNFMGSDTVPAIKLLKDYYGEPMAAFSVVASEHSTTTTWGRDREGEMYRHMIEKYGHQNIVSLVIDSYDMYNAADKLLGKGLWKDVVEMNATLVMRPDSGDPVEIVTALAQIADNRFGSKLNSKGFRVLNKVRILQGDGINHDGAIPAILDRAIENGFSAENFVFGMGGGRLQQMNRDTQKFAVKCSLARIDGEFVQVYKDPITDPGKRSFKGYVDVIEGHDRELVTVDGLTGPHPDSIMRTVYEMGEVLIEETWATVRARAEQEFQKRAAVFG